MEWEPKSEAWVKRCYGTHFVIEVTDADAEQLETQHWLSEALEWDDNSPNDGENWPAASTTSDALSKCHDAKAESFCGPLGDVLHEDADT